MFTKNPNDKQAKPQLKSLDTNSSKLKDAPVLGPYRLLEQVGEDAFGTLYQGLSSQKNASTLIRIIHPKICGNENFVVRFELLKSLLPEIRHKNLSRVISLENSGNIYALAKALPKDHYLEIKTLDTFNWKETPSPHMCLENIFEAIAQGLAGLESVKNAYYQQGVVYDCLNPKNIWIIEEKSPLDSGKKFTALLDFFCETFLYLGEQDSRIMEADFFSSKYTLEKEIQQNSISSPLLTLDYYPPKIKEGKPLNYRDVQYAFGSLLYATICNQLPRGFFPSPTSFHKDLQVEWQRIIQRCLAQKATKNYKNFQQIIKDIQAIAQKRSKPSKRQISLNKLEIPEAMVLIALDDKVELGAKDGPPNEQPRFKVHVPEFLIDKTPVTCGEFSAFLPHYKPSSYSKGEHCPATLISYNAALAYCAWRSQKEGLPLGTYRLPLEWEWEAAVRGLSTHQYPWGEQVSSSLMSCGKDKHFGAVDVKTYPSGRFGLFDMLGNTWEWTSSSYAPHPFSQHHEKAYEKKRMVIKGGSWFLSPKEIRASLRTGCAPHERRGDLGFRCARSIIL